MEDFKPTTNEVGYAAEHPPENMSNNQQNVTTEFTPAPPITQPVTSPQYNASAINLPPTQTVKRRTRRRSFAYLPEYLVMLVLLVTAVGAITSLVGVGIDSLIKSEDTGSSSSYSSYSDNFSSFELVASLSALVVVLPLFILLFIRTKAAETESPGVRNHRWRKGFLGTFLVIEGLALIWTFIDLAYDLIGRAVSSDNDIFSLFSSGGTDPWWQGVLVAFINAAILAYVLFVVSRDYRQDQGA